MGKSLVLVLLIGATASGLISCGTTHHFLPANPIPRKEWQLSINWHYDLDKNIKGLIVPEVSCYTGIGRNWNLGWGMEFPFLVTHVSAAKYGSDTLGSSWLGYATVNQVLLSGNNNPYFEGGVLHVDRARTYSQVYGLGLAYGDGLCNPLSTFLTKDVDENTRKLSHYRLMPVLRYQIAGRDLGISYVHYHGKTAAECNQLADTVRRFNDTMLILAAGTVDSLRPLPTQTDSGYYTGLWGLFLSSGDTVILAGPFYRHWLCGTGLLFDFFPRGGSLDSKGLEHEVVRIMGDKSQPPTPHSETSLYISISELEERVRHKETIVLTKYSPEIQRFVARLKSYRLDHSIGISTFAHPNSPPVP